MAQYHALPEGFTKDQPVAVASMVRVTLLMLVAFGLHLSGAQIAAVMLFVETASAFFTHRRVMPLHAAHSQAVGAYNEGYDDAAEDIAQFNIKETK